MMIDFKFAFSDIVYLKTDTDQTPRQVLQVSASPPNSVQYQLGQGDRASWHYELEISREKDLI